MEYYGNPRVTDTAFDPPESGRSGAADRATATVDEFTSALSARSARGFLLLAQDAAEDAQPRKSVELAGRE